METGAVPFSGLAKGTVPFSQRREKGTAPFGGAVFRPNGARGCSRGWSGAAALRPDAQPVERNGFVILFFSPRRGEGVARTDERTLIRRPFRRFRRPSGADVLKDERSHGLRTARHEAAGAPPVITVRRPVGAVSFSDGQGR